MRYWWVNHKQTFRHEFEGRYIWSPKRNRNGARNRHYDFLREVTPGDFVFSYADGAIRFRYAANAVGVGSPVVGVCCFTTGRRGFDLRNALSFLADFAFDRTPALGRSA